MIRRLTQLWPTLMGRNINDEENEPEAAPELLSHRPGEEDVLSEFERLPEVRAELVEEIPEVFNVEDITSLVTEEVEGDWTDLFADREIVLERCKEFVSLHRKWFAGAAAVILFAVVAVSFSGGGEAVAAPSSWHLSSVVSRSTRILGPVDQNIPPN